MAVPSQLALASHVLPGPYATPYTRSACPPLPPSSATRRPLLASQTRTKLSSQPVARTSPSERKAIERTRPRCPVRFATGEPVARNQTRTESSSLAVASRVPSALKASAQTCSVSASSSLR